MTQYVLYNTCFGGFTFNREFILSLFKRFSPETSEGQELFEEHIISDDNEYESESFFGDYVFLNYTNDCVKIKQKYVKNIKTNKCYYISTHMQEHRANPNLIKFLFERADSLTEEEFYREYDILITKLWATDKNKIVNEDGTKKYTIHNWKESDIIVSHMLTIGISGSLSNLEIQQVKPELTWRITEYDGSETVVAKFDYYKLIQELVNELQINNIIPSTGCSEIITKLINGKMTMKDLREFERS